jgi:hypothetical protein
VKVIPNFPHQLVIAGPKLAVELLRESEIMRVIAGGEPETPGNLNGSEM